MVAKLLRSMILGSAALSVAAFPGALQPEDRRVEQLETKVREIEEEVALKKFLAEQQVDPICTAKCNGQYYSFKDRMDCLRACGAPVKAKSVPEHRVEQLETKVRELEEEAALKKFLAEQQVDPICTAKCNGQYYSFKDRMDCLRACGAPVKAKSLSDESVHEEQYVCKLGPNCDAKSPKKCTKAGWETLCCSNSTPC